MALTKKEKAQLVNEYEQLINDAENIVVLNYDAITVSDSVAMRKQFRKEWALYKVVKKRVFALAAEKAGLEVELSNLSSSIAVLFLQWDGISTLKIVENYRKDWKKAKALSKLAYLGWWFDKEWKDAEYVTTLALLPSKEELVGKFLYMVKYPLQGFVTVNSNLISWFVRVLDQIKDKK